MTAADILTDMTVLDNELEVGAGEDDETIAIRACNLALRYLDIVAASMPKLLQGPITEFSTTANVETTAVPTGLLRLDNLWRLDGTGGKQIVEIDVLQRVGGHTPSLPWPWQIGANTSSPGAPEAAYYDGARFYWRPVPDTIYYLRPYGLFRSTQFATRATTFSRPDELGIGVATMAVHLLSYGTDDTRPELMALANTIFRPLLRALKKPGRTGPKSRHYSWLHTT